MSQPPSWPVPDAPQGRDGPAAGSADGGAATPSAAAAREATPPAHPDAGPAPTEPGGWAQQAWGHQPAWGAPGPPAPPGQPATGQPPTGQPPTGQPPTGQPPTGQPPTGQPGYAQAGQPQAPYAQPGHAPGWGQAPAGWVAQRPKPGVIPLRPIVLGEIFDGAFQAIRTNPRTMIGISAVVIAITSIITTVPQAFALVGFGSSDLFDPEAAQDLTTREVAASMGGLLSQLLVPALIQTVAVTVVTGLLIIPVSNAVVGRRTTPSQLWARTRHRVLALVVLAVLLIVTAAVLLALLLAPGVLVLVFTEQLALGVGLLILGALLTVVIYITVYYGFWSLAAPALLLENLSVLRSLRRSAGLVRRSFWRVLGIMLLTTLLVGVLSSVVSVPFSIAGAIIGFGQEPYQSFTRTLVQLLVAQVGTILSGAVLYPLTAAVTALLYIDLRMRQEGLDVELMRASEDPAG